MRPLPRLFIDTFELTIPVDEDQKQTVQDRLSDASERWINNLTSHTPQGRYEYRYKLEAPNGAVITIKSSPARRAANYLKLEYKPDQIGRDGASMLAAFLRFILGETYRQDFYSGNVNRMDITFDVRRIPLENFWIEDFRAGMKSSLIRGKSRQLETIYLGYKSRREFYAYDKNAEVEGRGEELSIKLPWVRFEYRYLSGDYMLGDLFSCLSNPYDKFEIRRYSSIPHLMDDHVSRWFFDACRLRGGKQVVDAMPEELRNDAIEAIKAFPLANFWLRRRALWFQLRGQIQGLLPDA